MKTYNIDVDSEKYAEWLTLWAKKHEYLDVLKAFLIPTGEPEFNFRIK